MRTYNGGRAVFDDRNELVFDFLRFARALQPKAILIENVAGLAKDARLNAICEEMEALGYSTTFKLLHLADYGVPQHRRRLVILGGKFGEIDFPTVVERRTTVRDAIAHLPIPGNSGDPLHDRLIKHCDRIQELIRQIPKNGGGRKSLPPEMVLDYHKDFNGFTDVYGRLHWDKVAPTITCGCINPSKGRFLHPEQDRAMTLREAALLQTFPLDYKFLLRRGKYPTATLIGNAFPPAFVKRLALQIHKYLQQKQPNCPEFEQLPLFDLQVYNRHSKTKNSHRGKGFRSLKRTANEVPTLQKFKQLDLFE